MNEHQDRSRQLVDLAISSGRIRQSPQTGFVHYCYNARDEDGQDTIPVYENVLFALALLRMRTVECITEAKDFLEKILSFQKGGEGEFAGNFPIYLHEYPQCKDRFISAYVLVPFFWMLRNFAVVLGSELKQKLTKSAQAALKHGLITHQSKAAPFHIAIRIAAAAKAFGELWNDAELAKEGEKLLEELRQETLAADFGSWYSPAYIGETMVALQMAYCDIAKSPWKDFLTVLSQNWHAASYCYTGPAVKVNQWGEEPQVTLYDYFLGFFNRHFSYRAFTNHPLQLQGALLQETTDTLPPMTYPFVHEGKVAEYQWRVYQQLQYAYSVMQKSILPNPALEKGYHAFRLVWGDENSSHSFVCQSSQSTFIDYAPTADGVDLIFYLAEPVQTDDKEQSREVAFYCDLHEDMKITVEGQSSTTFTIGQNIQLQDDHMTIKMTFLLEDGDGRFFGHISPGNRPSQLNVKGKQRFATYDWSVFLRTVRRYTPCRLKVRLTIQPKETA